jgi:hypothetical protein
LSGQRYGTIFHQTRELHLNQSNQGDSRAVETKREKKKTLKQENKPEKTKSTTPQYQNYKNQLLSSL